jgi:hypothetical protein
MHVGLDHSMWAACDYLDTGYGVSLTAQGMCWDGRESGPSQSMTTSKYTA